MTHPPQKFNNPSLQLHEIQNQPIPQDPQAERGLIGCMLYGAKSDDLDPLILFHEGRQLIVVTIEALQQSGTWVTPKSTQFQHLQEAARSNLERVAAGVESISDLWPTISDARNELVQCFESVTRPEDVDYFVGRLHEVHCRREAIDIHLQRLNAAYSGELELALDGTERSTLSVNPTKFSIESVSSSELATSNYTLDYFVDGVLTCGQPCVIGGASKSLKTSIAIDLAISLDSGKEFLNQYAISKRAKVGVISGESGKASIQSTAKRISECKQLELADLGVAWAFDIPQISDPSHLRELKRFIQKNGIEVLILDPVYLALLNRESAGNATNVFMMGAVLRAFSLMISELGTTLILIHHIGKGAARANLNAGEPPELEDLSMSGFAEFARQWLLIGRRSRYDDGSGDHQLWLRYGGSAGHGGLAGVDVREGKQTDLGGRRWSVTVRDASECREERAANSESRKSERDEHRAAQKLEADIAKIQAVASKFREGETQTKIAEAAGISNQKCGTALNALEDAGLWERCDVQKSNRKRPYPGFRPVSNDLQGNGTDSDKSD